MTGLLVSNEQFRLQCKIVLIAGVSSRLWLLTSMVDIFYSPWDQGFVLAASGAVQKRW